MNSLFFSKIKSQRVSCWLTKLIACALIAFQVIAPINNQLFAIESGQPTSASKAQTNSQPKFEPNRAAPTVSRPSATPQFSDPPTDNEIFRAHFFAEPLVPAGTTSPEENKELVHSLVAFSQRGTNDDVTAVTQFLSEHVNSPWRLSLLNDLGIFYRHTGRFLKALDAWEEAWRIGKAETRPEVVAVANSAVAELAELSARLGRQERLTPLLAEIEGRDFRGPTSEKIQGVREGLWLMENRPENSFKCGPFALGRIRAFSNPANARDPKITAARSSTNGTSLAQVAALAEELNMHLQPAKRKAGAEIIVPAVVHWKAGHYAALVKEENGNYLVQDPTFGKDIWISRAAIDEETSGYCLVRSGALPEGWQPVDESEAARVWGKGQTTGNDPNRDKCGDQKTGSNCGKGMAQYAFHVMLVSLNIVDTPVGYTPPRGPAVNFTVTYNQREANQPGTFTYSNLGNKWTFDWLAYITDDPNNGSADAAYFLRGGGTDRYTGYASGRYDYQQESRGELDRISSVRYEQTFPDGSKEIYDLPDGSTSYPRKVFLTQIIDPTGNAVTFSYDSNFRLVAATDAVAQVTLVYYGSSDTNNPLYYKITKVTDPFGRSATFQYNASGQLTNIIDVIGINSQFSYGSSDFINSLTTPYGTTTFSNYTSGTTRVLEATDPLGQTEHLEYHDAALGIPYSEGLPPTGIDYFNQYINYRDSYFWDKKAWHDYPGDYTKSHIYHFLHRTDINTTSGILESDKMPLESRVWRNYDGQPAGGGDGPAIEGTNGSPTKVARVLDDGSTQLYQYSYNHLGHVKQSIDPVGRTNLYTYAANGIDLTEVRVANGANNDLIASFTYNSQHLPLTATAASGQVTHFAYNAYGQINGITNALGQSTTIYYNNLGLVTNIIGALSGATNGFTYDATNRIRTITDSDGYAVTYDWDNLDRVTRITFPDTTYQQIVYDKLDPVLVKDRRGHWSHKTYDALRRLTSVEDALGRITQFGWCDCGSLGSITDPLGTTTTWLRDIEGRPTTKIFPDGSQITFAYETMTSRLNSETDARNQTKLYNYYTDDNLRRIDYLNAVVGTPSASFTYDTNYNRLLTMTDGTGVTTYNYNPITTSPMLGAGRLASVDGPLSNDTISFFYDELGRITNRAINNVAEAATLDTLGRPTIITNALGRFTNVYVGLTTRIATNFYPNGQFTALSYFNTNSDVRLQTICNQKADGSTISKFDCTYDADGQIQTWTQQADANSPTVWSAEYDASDQLVEARIHTNTVAGSIIKQFVYSYDKAGNRTSESIQGGTGNPAVNNSGFNALNELTSVAVGGAVRFKGHLSETGMVLVAGSPAVITAYTNFSAYAQLPVGTNTNSVVATDLNSNVTSNRYRVVITNNGVAETLTYDLNGNLTSALSAVLTNTYEWDGANRLTAINSSANRSEFTYDGLGRRVRNIEKANGVVLSDKRFVWVGVSIAEERDTTGSTVTKRFFNGGEQISGTNCFFTSDHLGSIREMTDSSGTLRARYDYDPYGRPTKTSGDLDADFGFTGHYYDTASGLHMALYRAYDAVAGRWLNRDPIQEYGGLNLYAYAGNNPVNLIDPLGLCEQNAGDIMDWLSQHATESYQYGGFFDKIEGTLANGLQAAIGFLGGDIVKYLSTKSGSAEGCGNHWTAIGYGVATIGAIVLAAFSFGGEGAVAAEGTGLYSTIGGESMDAALFQRIQSAFQRTPGRIMESSPASELHLGPNPLIEGETLSKDVIALRMNPSTSSVYEELIHTAQLRRGMTDRTQMEIEAAQKLIRFADRYHIPPEQTQATIRRLNALLKSRQ
jgi:RHS repeat-associated protein